MQDRRQEQGATKRTTETDPWVLVVDDDPDHRLMVSRALDRSQPNLHVETAEGVHDAIEHLEQGPDKEGSSEDRAPHFVLVDLDLEDGTGLDVLEHMAAHPEFGSVPAIVLSSCTEQERIRACYDQGAAGFVSKPVRLDELQENVDVICDLWISQA